MTLLDSIHPNDRTLQCDSCGYSGVPDTSVKLNGNVKATCARCNNYIKFVHLIDGPVLLSDEELPDPDDLARIRFHAEEDIFD